MWPTAVALGFLVFLGAIGTGVQTASASQGDLCKIEGPYVEGKGLQKWMNVGDQALIVARTDNNSGQVESYDVDLDDEIGDSDITTITESDSPWQLDDEPGVDQVDGNQVIQLSNVDEEVQLSEDWGDEQDDGENTLNEDIEDILAFFEDEFLYEFIGDVCTGTTDTISELIDDCIDSASDVPNTTACDEDAWEELGENDDITPDDIAALIAGLIADGEVECDDIAQAVDRYIIGINGDDEDAIVDDIFDICAGEATEGWFCENTDTESGLDPDSCDLLDSWWDDLSPIIVTCVRAGVFEVTFTEDDDPDQQLTIEVTCKGEPSSDSTIAASPNKIEIVPAMGSLSHSLITVTLLDDDGNPAGAGFEVDFTTNRCTIETAGVDTLEEYTAANATTAGGFRSYNLNVPSTAAAIEASAAANVAIDSTRDADTTVAFVSGSNTVAAAILGCSPADTGATTALPGVATISAYIEVLGGQDVIETTTVTVVGPPADLKVTASPSTLKCGEKATITATVKDSIGQNVSEHTRVEAVTNFGGVLGGTGAVAGSAGPVVPVSSTLAETYDGVATFYLLTSEAHVGPYEVVVTTGGAGSVTMDLGGVFSTRPQVAQQTVTCTGAAPAPAAPAPTISAPRTGTGSITPPSTGDAGLADSTSSSWALFSVIGAAAFAVAGLAGLKFVRR